MRAQVLELVFSAVDEINRQLAADKQLARSEAAVIAGAESALDSLAFLNLIVTAEELVTSTFRRPINLASALMEFGEEAQPPRTVGELTDIITSRLDGAAR